MNIPNSEAAFSLRKANGYSPRNYIKPEEEKHEPVLITDSLQSSAEAIGDDISVGAPDSPAPSMHTVRRPALLDGFKLLEATGMVPILP